MTHTFVRTFIFYLLLLSPSVFASTLLLMTPQKLTEVHNRIQKHQLNKTEQKRLDTLLAQANKYLLQANPSVMEKSLLPPTKDKHDYLSISRYWWPDPSKKDGLPWIRKDGKTNPDTQTDAVDRPRFGTMAKAVKTLALSYTLTDEPKYAEKAASMLRTWFLDSGTRMNPHLQFAQSVPGNPKSRRSGILDGRLIPEHVLDAITLISSSEYWTAQDDKTMRQWLTNYLTWLTESKVGKQGAKQMHNHGSWYRFQVAALAQYLGNDALFNRAVQATKLSLAEQFDAKGAQPYEISRTRSFFYHCFNLSALMSIATVAEKGGKPFWNYETDNARGLKLGIEYVIPVFTEHKTWPHPNSGIKPTDLTIALINTKDKFPGTAYNDILFKLLSDNHLPKKHFDDIMLKHPEYLLAKY